MGAQFLICLLCKKKKLHNVTPCTSHFSRVCSSALHLLLLTCTPTVSFTFSLLLTLAITFTSCVLVVFQLCVFLHSRVLYESKSKNPHATTRNGRLCNHSLFVSTAQPEALQDSSFNKTFFWSQDDLRCRSQEPIQTTPLVRQLTQKVKIPATPTSLKPHARGTQKRRCHLAPLHTPNHIRRLFCQGLLVHPTQSTRHCTFSVVLMCTLPRLLLISTLEIGTNFPKRSWPRSPYPNKHLPSEQPSPKSLLHRNYPKALNSSGEMNLLRSCWSDSWPIFCATGIRGTPPTRKKHP